MFLTLDAIVEPTGYRFFCLPVSWLGLWSLVLMVSPSSVFALLAFSSSPSYFVPISRRLSVVLRSFGRAYQTLTNLHSPPLWQGLDKDGRPIPIKPKSSQVDLHHGRPCYYHSRLPHSMLLWAKDPFDHCAGKYSFKASAIPLLTRCFAGWSSRSSPATF